MTIFFVVEVRHYVSGNRTLIKPVLEIKFPGLTRSRGYFTAPENRENKRPC